MNAKSRLVGEPVPAPKGAWTRPEIVVVPLTFERHRVVAANTHPGGILILRVAGKDSTGTDSYVRVFRKNGPVAFDEWVVPEVTGSAVLDAKPRVSSARESICEFTLADGKDVIRIEPNMEANLLGTTFLQGASRVAWSVDGTLLAAGDASGNIRVVEYRAPDRNPLLLRACRGKGPLKPTLPDKPKEVVPVMALGRSIRSLKFDVSGRMLWCLTDAGLVRLDIGYRGNTQVTRWSDVTTDGESILAVSDDRACRAMLLTNDHLQVFGYGRPETVSTGINPTFVGTLAGYNFACADRHGKVEIWNYRSEPTAELQLTEKLVAVSEWDSRIFLFTI